MKQAKAGVFTLLLVSVINCLGQKSDYVWLSGYDSKDGHGSGFGNSKLDFNHKPLDITYDSLGMSFDFTNISFCDSNGNLLFYGNGIYIANSLDEHIENSDSLDYGYVDYMLDTFPEVYGERIPQGILAIPIGSNLNEYYIIYDWVDTFEPTGVIIKRVLVALLDMSANGGNGEVIYKNQTVVNNILNQGLSATKHGNGRDWWLLVQKNNTNCYYRIEITPNGIDSLPSLTCGGDTTLQGDIGACCFSPDGSKYVYLSTTGGLNIFDFDRCSGELSNPINLPLPVFDDSSWVGMGVAISPTTDFFM